MVFSSLPPYPDPSNWQQNDHIIASSGTNNFFPPLHAAEPPPPPQPHGAGSVRPGSMSERARFANIPMPETALKCPRCDSTNTKFCYFNNYSLSQPRHFCKTCRRYWTRGGALRTVPVGGGCRRNKRSKSSASKSSPASSDRQTITSTSKNTVSTNSATANLLGLNPPLRFMSPLTQVTNNYTGGMGLNYTGVETGEMNFHWSGSGGIEPWQVQQFPLFGGLDPSPTGMYQFQGGESVFLGSEVSQAGRPQLSSSLLTQLASVKMEGNPDLNLSRELLEGIQGNEEWN